MAETTMLAPATITNVAATDGMQTSDGFSLNNQVADPKCQPTSEAEQPETQPGATTTTISNEAAGEEVRDNEEPSATGQVAFSVMALAPELFQQLACQVEYYFSQKNLDKDTYVQTLRDLNDGCVPVSILANFGKVRQILSMGIATTLPTADLIAAAAASMWEWAPDAVWHAVTNYSTLLDGVEVCRRTGGRVDALATTTASNALETQQLLQRSASTGSTSSNDTILAIGTKTGLPLEVVSQPNNAMFENAMNMMPTPMQSFGVEHENASVVVETEQVEGYPESPVPDSASSNNMLFLRDVAPDVTPQDIAALFNEQATDCPPVVAIYPDVAHCWFVQFDTEDRNDLLRVLLFLRMSGVTLGGFPVHARFKSSVSTMVPVDAAPLQLDPVAAQGWQWSGDIAAMGDGTNTYYRKKKKPRSKKKKRGANARSPSSPQPSEEQSKSSRSGGANRGVGPPPSLGEDNFPALMPRGTPTTSNPEEGAEDENKPVEWAPAGNENVNDEKTPRLGSDDEEEDEDEDGTDPSAKNTVASDGASTVTTASSSTDPASQTNNNRGVEGATQGNTNFADVVQSQSTAVLKSGENKGDLITGTGKQADAIAQPTVGVKQCSGSGSPWKRGRSFAEIVRHSTPEKGSHSANTVSP